MPLSSSQIITLALQDARKNAPLASGGGFSVQAGQLFQMILDDLCYKYDLKVNLANTNISISGTAIPPNLIGIQTGVGPYSLPSDYLRMAQDEVTYAFQGAPHKMINDDLANIDLLGLIQTNTNYPDIFATDFSTTPVSFYVWPAPVQTINLNIRYFKLQPSITSPEVSTSPPWFNDGMYLKSRLTGELLKPGAAAKPFLEESQLLLDQYLKMEDDSEGRAIIMKMDERQFPRGHGRELPRTKLQDL